MFSCDLHPGLVQRYTLYLRYLRTLDKHGSPDITIPVLAKALHLKVGIIQKDLQSLYPEKESLGYDVADLIHLLERYVGEKIRVAVLVGAGKLGKALLSYAGFIVYDMDIIAGFDVSSPVTQNLHGKPIYPMKKFPEICNKLEARVGVIATPGEYAQAICDKMVEANILAIWNFTPVHLSVPESVLVVNTDMCATLLRLMAHAYGEMPRKT